jgi:hypothetical protein
MARMNEDGQWIVLMGLLVAVALFFLALIVNQSALVGQTTAEAVLEFPKNDIRDLREAIFDYVDEFGENGNAEVQKDITAISLERKNAVVSFTVDEVGEKTSDGQPYRVEIHYNNGVTVYNESTVHYRTNE